MDKSIRHPYNTSSLCQNKIPTSQHISINAKTKHHSILVYRYVTHLKPNKQHIIGNVHNTGRFCQMHNKIYRLFAVNQ